ncbi:MAG: hypothetical protein KDD69_13940 [Bdellovibrionales bacterium]|nr:hypothetical protein [Bdellovibrionales bacterium]
MPNDPTKLPEFTTDELLGAYYDAMCEAVDFVTTQIIPVLHGQLKLKKDEEAILGIFYRMHALASSLARLNNKIDFNGAALIARTMFELLVDLRFLTSPNVTSEDIERFREFAVVDRFRKAQNA